MLRQAVVGWLWLLVDASWMQRQLFCGCGMPLDQADALADYPLVWRRSRAAEGCTRTIGKLPTARRPDSPVGFLGVPSVHGVGVVQVMVMVMAKLFCRLQRRVDRLTTDH